MENSLVRSFFIGLFIGFIATISVNGFAFSRAPSSEAAAPSAPAPAQLAARTVASTDSGQGLLIAKLLKENKALKKQVAELESQVKSLEEKLKGNEARYEIKGDVQDVSYIYYTSCAPNTDCVVPPEHVVATITVHFYEDLCKGSPNCASPAVMQERTIQISNTDPQQVHDQVAKLAEYRSEHRPVIARFVGKNTSEDQKTMIDVELIEIIGVEVVD